MAAKLGSLILDIRAGVANLQKDMGQIRGVLDGALGKLNGSLKTFAGAAAGYFAADKLLEFAHATLENADNMSKLAAKTGVAVETLTALQHGADLSGISAEEMGAALGKLARNAVAAAEGSKAQAEAFRGLGISVTDATGGVKGVDTLLDELAAKFAAMPDGPVKTAAAMEVFGKAGAKLLPLLNGGREGLEEFRREAAELGLVLTSETAASAELFNDNLSRVGAAVQGVGNRVMEALLPTLVSTSERMVEGAKSSQELTDVIVAGFKLAYSAVRAVAGVFQVVGKLIATYAASFAAVIEGDFAGAWEAYKAGAIDSFETTVQVGKDIAAVWEDTPAKVEAAAGKITAATSKVTKSQVDAGKEAKRAADAVISSVERTAALRASLTADEVDDIEASYRFQILALERKIADEKTTEQERAAYLLELEAVRLKQAQDLYNAYDAKNTEAERRKVDVAQEMAERRAAITETQVDDIRVAAEAELEALRRRHEDGLLTDQEFAEQKVLLAQQTEARITAAGKVETDKRTEEQRKAQEQVAGFAIDTLGNAVFAPLQSGFEGIAQVLDGLKNAVVSLLIDLAKAAAFKAVLGVASGGIGGGLLKLLGFAEGGKVPGYAPGRDVVPAMLSPGEFVVNPVAARRNLPLLESINRTGFAMGGLVGAGGGGGVTNIMNVNALEVPSWASFAPRAEAVAIKRYTDRRSARHEVAIAAAGRRRAR